MAKKKAKAPQAPPPPYAGAALTWTTEQRRIGDLLEWDKNPRQLTEKQAQDLRDSLARFGYVEPVAINTDGTIVGGHMRRRVLLAQGLLDPDAMVEVRVPSRTLTAEEFAELAVRLNKNSGEWDFDRLANMFDESALMTWGFEAWEFGRVDAADDATSHTAVGPGPGAGKENFYANLDATARKLEVLVPQRDFAATLALLERVQGATGAATHSDAFLELLRAWGTEHPAA